MWLAHADWKHASCAQGPVTLRGVAVECFVEGVAVSEAQPEFFEDADAVGF